MLSKNVTENNGQNIYLKEVLLPLAEMAIKESNLYDGIFNPNRDYLPYLLWVLNLKTPDKLQDANVAATLSGLSKDEQIEMLETVLKDEFMTLNQSTALSILKRLSNECNNNGDFATITIKMIDFVAFDKIQWDKVCKPFADDLRNRLSKNDINLGKEDTKHQLLKLEIQTWLQESDVIAKTLKQKDICKLFGLSRQDFNYLAHNLDENNAKPLAQVLSSSDFMALNNKGNEWLITGLIPNQGVTIIGAVAGCGKTTLAYDLAGSIIYGDDFLGEQPLQQGNILIVGSDELPCFSQDKLINRGIIDGFDFMINWDVSQWLKLDETIELKLPKLVIVDSFASIHSDDPNFSENSSQAGLTVKMLEKLSCKYSVPIVLIHHLGKSNDNKGVNRLRGSSAIAAACSNVLILDGEGTVKKLKQVKVRGSEPLDLEIEMLPDTGTFKVIAGNQDNSDIKSLAKRLQVFFESNQGSFYGKDDLLGLFPNDDYENLRQSLTRLVKQGKIGRLPCPNNKRNRIWGLA